MTNYNGYKWIKVKNYKFDSEKSWEENYKALLQHHVEETTFLIDKVRELAGKESDVQNHTAKEEEKAG